MSFEFEGKEIETNETGYMINAEDWSADLARHMAVTDHIDLTDRHWDVINYLRAEYTDNNQTQPNTRTIVKAMSAAWGEKVKQGDLYELFPGDPSKQGGKISGLPESRRKGGY